MKNLISNLALGLFLSASVIAAPATMALPPHLPTHDACMDYVEEATETKTIEAVTLTKVSACEGIEARVPVGVGTEFSASQERVYIHSSFTLPKGQESTIKHLYYFKGKLVSEVALDVKGPAFRTYSYKTLRSGMVGDWKVEVAHVSGEVFETIQFTVVE